MKRVNPKQDFGLQEVTEKILNIPKENVGVKCGWFLDSDESAIRTHAVTAAQIGDGTIIGSVVLTAIDISSNAMDDYQSIYTNGNDVILLHENVAGETLRNETKRMLELGINTSLDPVS